MNTESTAIVDKTKHTLSLTRAALYILEGVLQDPGPADTMAKTQLWAKVWSKVRKANDRNLILSWSLQGVDFEKTQLRGEGESELAWEHRRAEFESAHKQWADQPVMLSISDKHRDVCRDALKWIYEHRNEPKTRTRLDNSPHVALLLTALGLVDPISDDE